MAKLARIETAERIKIIKEGIKRFLDDNALFISNQNTKRIRKHLIDIFGDNKSITISMVHNYLQEAYEYQEFNIEGLDNPSSKEDCEDALMKILVTSDKKTFGYSKIWGLILVLFVIYAIALSLNLDSSRHPISSSQQKELRALVSEIVKVDDGESHTKIWNDVKKLDDVTKHGYKSSYKDFDEKQYVAAKKYLKKRLE